jgi:hypothetical protein
MKQSIVGLSSLLLCLVLTVGCDQNDNGAERFGEKVDNAMENAADRVEDAAEEVDNKVEDAAEELDNPK